MHTASSPASADATCWEQTVENVIDKAEELGAKQAPCEAPIWIDLKEEEVVYNA